MALSKLVRTLGVSSEQLHRDMVAADPGGPTMFRARQTFPRLATMRAEVES